MEIHVCAQSKSRRVKTAWISLQPDGSVSLGLTDKTFVAPEFVGQFNVFSLYNQVEAAFVIREGPLGLKKITAPHFTYHPRMLFHLTGKEGKHSVEVFKGLNDVEMTVAQYGKLRWIRAISPPMSQMKNYGVRNDSLTSTIQCIPVESEDVSIGIALDFVPPNSGSESAGRNVKFMDHGAIKLRCEIVVLKSQIPTLAWFHSF